MRVGERRGRREGEGEEGGKGEEMVTCFFSSPSSCWTPNFKQMSPIEGKIVIVLLEWWWWVVVLHYLTKQK